VRQLSLWGIASSNNTELFNIYISGLSIPCYYTPWRELPALGNKATVKRQSPAIRPRVSEPSRPLLSRRCEHLGVALGKYRSKGTILLLRNNNRETEMETKLYLDVHEFTHHTSFSHSKAGKAT
jgi:hypothetical protein